MGLSAAEERTVAKNADHLGLALSAQQLEGLGVYLDQLEAWNRRSNLVAAKDRAVLLNRHVLDGLALCPLLASWGTRELADVGSGGGVPGIPLAIVGGVSVTLIEPRRKKASFLRSVARECFTWNIEVAECRADELRDQEEFEVVASRAAFAPAALPDEAGFLVAKGGRLVAYATEDSAPPQDVGAGFGRPSLEPYALPSADRDRLLLAIWQRQSA